MGSSTKRKSSGQPETAGMNGTPEAESSDGVVDQGEPKVTVSLINIDSSVHMQTNVGDRVRRNGPEVSVRAGVLGYVRQSDLDVLEDRGLIGGEVSDLSDEDDLSALVTFTI